MNQNEFIDVIKCKRTSNEFMSIFDVILFPWRRVSMDMYKEENWGIIEGNGLCHIWQKENKNI